MLTEYVLFPIRADSSVSFSSLAFALQMLIQLFFRVCFTYVLILHILDVPSFLGPSIAYIIPLVLQEVLLQLQPVPLSSSSSACSTTPAPEGSSGHTHQQLLLEELLFKSRILCSYRQVANSSGQVFWSIFYDI